jgi:hypothetical protein
MFYLQTVGDGNDNCNKCEEFQFKAFSEQVHNHIKYINKRRWDWMS